jgi:hypothetical protein
MTQEELNYLADCWLEYWHAHFSKDLRKQEELAWLSDVEYELRYNLPKDYWNLILAIHHKDQSIPIQQVLSAGPVEDLLAKHGESFIERVEEEARRDPQFAKLLGGVWKNRMTDEVWARLQAVWDRRGWDGIPE